MGSMLLGPEWLSHLLCSSFCKSSAHTEETCAQAHVIWLDASVFT